MSSFAFPSTSVGNTSTGQAFALSNTGTAPLTLSSITSSNTAFKLIGGTCVVGQAVAAGSSCTVAVAFSPTSGGTTSGTLTFGHDAVPGTSTISLSGTGSATGSPLATVSAQVTIASTPLGSTSPAQVVTLKSSGTAGLVVSSVALNNALFAVTGGTCAAGVAIAAGSSCTVIITFSPAALGAASASLTFTHNATPNTSTVSLSSFATATVAAAGSNPVIVAADCSRLLSQAQAVASLSISGADMQQVADILQATSPNHGYQLFARLPSTVMWWVRSQAGPLDIASIGSAVHETNHEFDRAMRNTCNSDHKARLLLDGAVIQTDLISGQLLTANYSIADETIPASLKTALRYYYITRSATVPGNDFAIMLDELNAYTGAAEFELDLLSSATYSPLMPQGVKADVNAGGQVDFMLYTLAYLKAARLNHPATYTAIQGQANTIAYIQLVWARAEANLVALYPYTVLSGAGGMVVSKDALAAAYSSDFIAELDNLGITHQPLSAWSATYLH